ncbi:MAG: hypothetical protein VKJ02_00150 [Snowella sp.]|nr:hypothetical protein [Snowella sp.]
MENYRFIIIGIYHYRSFPALQGIEADLSLLQKFLRQDLQLSERQALVFSDRVKFGQGRVIYPNRHNLLKSVERVPNIVFFQGYATQAHQQDYLLPIDADYQDLENSAVNLRSLLTQFQPQTHAPALLILDVATVSLVNPISSEALLLARQLGVSLIARFNRFPDTLGGLATAFADACHYYQDALSLDLLELYLRDRLGEDGENPLIILSHTLSARQQPLFPSSLPKPPIYLPSEQSSRVRIKPQPAKKPRPLSPPAFSLTITNLRWLGLLVPLFLFSVALLSFRWVGNSKQFLSSPTDQAILEGAKIHLKRHQASDFIRAIAELRKIPPASPLYPEAQKRITFWSQTILEIAQGRAEVGNWPDAIAAAQLVPMDQRALSNLAQKNIENWQQKIVLESE